MKYLLCIVIICAMPSSFAFAQNHFNIGVNFGPSLSFTSVSRSEHGLGVRSAFPSRPNYHLGFTSQFLFENKFGLEAGVNISTKNVDLQVKNSGQRYHAFMDSFSFPFLLQTKLLYPQNPFRKLNFFLGTTIEYQRFIDGSEHLRVMDKVSGFVPNLSIGSSISYRKGNFGKLELGMFFNYALKSYYSYLLKDTQANTFITTSPVAHYLRFELRYFFVNLESKNKLERSATL